MKVATRYLHNQVLNAVLYVLVGFLGLFGFFDFMEEISAVGRNGYAIWDAVLVTLLSIPSHVYELMPICVLIGTIYVLAQMAQHSEFTVLRISGLSPINALKALMGLGVVLSLFTWLMGDYLGPKAEQYAQNIKAQYGRNYVEGKTGAWLKDNQGALHYVVNVQSMLPDGKLRQIKLFEFNAKGELQRKITAESGQVEADHRWHLEQVQFEVYKWVNAKVSPDMETIRLSLTQQAQWDWSTALTPDVVVVALLTPDRMSTFDLYGYMTHLQDNAQSASAYEIQFWKKLFYPLACLVMVVLALPFAYLHFRSEGISGKVFGGIMLGISFVLINQFSAHFGLLNNWTPWWAAAMPSLLYLSLSLTAFFWLVLYR